MKQRILYGCLPAYARAEVPENSDVCFIGKRSWQIYDSARANELGREQRDIAERLSVPGDGTSLFFASSANDAVLIQGAGAGSDFDAALSRRLQCLADHLGRCGLETGKTILRPQLRAEEIKEHAADRFVSVPMFSSELCSSLFDNASKAEKTRAVVDHLNSKADCNQHLSGALMECRTAAFDSDVDRERYFQEYRGPWVVKPVHGAGSHQIAFAKNRTELLGLLNECRTSWGRSVCQKYFDGQDVFAYFLLDPHENEPCFVAAGRSLMQGQKYVGNIWDADFERTSDLSLPYAIARSHHSFLRERGAMAILEGQDWRNGFRHYLETNPRICGGTPTAIYRARAPMKVERVSNLVCHIPVETADKFLECVRPFEATAERGSGVVVYAIVAAPSPAIMILVVNDFDGAIEANVREML